MKKNFPEYYRPEDKDIEEAGKTAAFIFDTNILLDFYRINPKTSEKALETITKYKDRIYITRHSDVEYHRHHYEVPAQMCEMMSQIIIHYNYDKIKAPLEELLRKPIAGCVFPKDITKEFIAKLKKTSDGIIEEIKTIQKHYNENYETHILQDKISELFEEHVLDGLPPEKIKDIIENEGPRRYKENIPPGYMDAGKATDKSDNNMFGDLIIWKEILDFVEKAPQHVFFICRDQKEDWVSQIGSHFIGPRLELLVEFRSKAKDKIFHILTLTEFLEIFGKDFSKEELDAIPNSSTLSFDTMIDHYSNSLYKKLQYPYDEGESIKGAEFIQALSRRLRTMGNNNDESYPQIDETDN